MKLSCKALALTTGILWGLTIFIVTWWIIVLDGATGEVPWLGHIYRGYNISLAGSFIGLVWGVVDGMIGGAIFAWLYNLIAGTSSSGSTS